jgi:hypothetical protein
LFAATGSTACCKQAKAIGLMEFFEDVEGSGVKNLKIGN